MNSTPPDKTISSRGKLAFNLRILSSVEEFQRAEQLQREIWGITDDTEIVPKDVMLIVQKNGGLALGAFTPANEMIGLLFGFLGQSAEGRWKHCSHMMGVLPAYRIAGVGEALKNYQREFVLKQGLDLITWTVNPLEGVNAGLNFGKLGVVCRKYYPNFYGVMADELNLGLPSDRFEVEWWIKSQRVEKHLSHSQPRLRLADMLSLEAQPVNRTQQSSDLRLPGSPDLGLDAPVLLFEVPSNFQEIKAASLKTALAWIEHARAVFEAYLARGYVVSAFISETGEGERRNYFVLERDLGKILGR